jgi:tRNA modification GTPase
VNSTDDAPDTIFALSSGALPAAIAVIRISGPRATQAAARLAGPLPDVRQVRLRAFTDPDSGERIDEGLVLRFPAGGSETGEDLVELHCHGSRAAVLGIEAVLARQPGLRRAGPGEFTRRAFLNGKTDLARIEGLADLIAAETAPQRRAAMAMMGGALSRRIADWAARLIGLSARIEAILDFSDEGDVAEAGMRAEVKAGMAALAAALEADLARPPAERLKAGIRVVIAGPPNAGKSTLLNALAGREAAIVSPVAGTTRDVIEVPLAFAGTPYLLADTAGLHGAGEADAIEAIGMARARERLAAADIILWLGAPVDRPDVPGARVLTVTAKADLPLVGPRSDEADVTVSAVTGAGMDALIDALGAQAETLLPRAGDYALSARQRAIMVRALAMLREGAALDDEILIGEMLRGALAALDELTGQATTEAVLDELFGGFCIGK